VFCLFFLCKWRFCCIDAKTSAAQIFIPKNVNNCQIWQLDINGRRKPQICDFVGYLSGPYKERKSEETCKKEYVFSLDNKAAILSRHCKVIVKCWPNQTQRNTQFLLHGTMATNQVLGMIEVAVCPRHSHL
jgi:hypothetical protein